MVLPSFSDIGKSAKDLFEKNFHFGLVKAEHKLKTFSGVDITASGSHNLDSGKISGTLESKYKFSKYGLSVIEKWTTSNTATTELTMENTFINGLKQIAETTFEPNTGKFSWKLKNSFKNDHVNSNVDMHFLNVIPNMAAAVVAGYRGYLAGLSFDFDFKSKSLTKHSVAFAYQVSDFAMSAQIVDNSVYSMSIYQRLSDVLESAVSVNWASNTYATKFGAVARYQVNKDSWYKIKMDNHSMLGIAYGFSAQDGVMVTLGGQIDTMNLNGGGHKVGLGLEFSSA